MTNTTGAAELPEAILLRIAEMCEQLAAQISNPAHSEVRGSYPRDAAELRRLHAQVEALSAAQAGVPADARPLEELLVWAVEDGVIPMNELFKLDRQDAIEKFARRFVATTHAAPQPSPSPAPAQPVHVQNSPEIEHIADDVSKNGRESNMTAQPGQEGEREAIIRAAVAAMPYTNPMVADDLIDGHTMHTEADDIVAIWRAARAAPQPATADAVDARITAIEQTIRDYHYALDTRQHGGVAQDRAFNMIRNIMGMCWTRGAEAAQREVKP